MRRLRQPRRLPQPIRTSVETRLAKFESPWPGWTDSRQPHDGRLALAPNCAGACFDNKAGRDRSRTIEADDVYAAREGAHPLAAGAGRMEADAGWRSGRCRACAHRAARASARDDSRADEDEGRCLARCRPPVKPNGATLPTCWSNPRTGRADKRLSPNPPLPIRSPSTGHCRDLRRPGRAGGRQRFPPMSRARSCHRISRLSLPSGRPAAAVQWAFPGLAAIAGER